MRRLREQNGQQWSFYRLVRSLTTNRSKFYVIKYKCISVIILLSFPSLVRIILRFSSFENILFPCGFMFSLNRFNPKLIANLNSPLIAFKKNCENWYVTHTMCKKWWESDTLYWWFINSTFQRYSNGFRITWVVKCWNLAEFLACL